MRSPLALILPSMSASVVLVSLAVGLLTWTLTPPPPIFVEVALALLAEFAVMATLPEAAWSWAPAATVALVTLLMVEVMPILVTAIMPPPPDSLLVLAEAV